MIWAVNVWEYDVSKAGKTFLESKGFKLSDKKEEYVVQVGCIFRDNKNLQEEFYRELKKLLLESLPPDVKVIRYYVDEVVIDKQHKFVHPIFYIKEKPLKFILVQTPTTFVKVYKNEEIRISKSFILQSNFLWKQIANILSSKLSHEKIILEIQKLVRYYLSFKLPLKEYIVHLNGQPVVVQNHYVIHIQDDKQLEEIPKDLNERFYYNLLVHIVRPLLTK